MFFDFNKSAVGFWVFGQLDDLVNINALFLEGVCCFLGYELGRYLEDAARYGDCRLWISSAILVYPNLQVRDLLLLMYRGQALGSRPGGVGRAGVDPTSVFHLRLLLSSSIKNRNAQVANPYTPCPWIMQGTRAKHGALLRIHEVCLLLELRALRSIILPQES